VRGSGELGTGSLWCLFHRHPRWLLCGSRSDGPAGSTCSCSTF